MTRAPRSLLYVPADNARALQKARDLHPDGLIIDLEDAVAPERKTLAHNQARAALHTGFAVPTLLRINGLNTPWAQAEAELVQHVAERISGVVLPKAETVAQVQRLALPSGLGLWLMIETPLGVLSAPALAAQAGVAGLLAGTNDLSRELLARPGPERQELQYALQATVLAARAHGRAVLDAVYNNVRDQAGFEAECEQGRRLGFDGKTVIHPGQIEVAQRAFGVSETQAQAAQALLSAWQTARAQGHSVLNYGGQLVEALHIRQAKALLAQYQEQIGKGQ